MAIISVIIPCYNGAAYIAECIESVLSQTLKDWEMFVIDDCSTDDSAEIIKQYVNKDSRINYYCTSKRSGSPSLPRNIGIEHSNGEFIAFLDGDDVWFPNKLEEQYRFLTDNNYEFVYSNYEKMSCDGLRKHREVKVRASSTYFDTLETCCINSSTVLISRKLIGTSRFKQIPKEDYGFWLEILRKGVVAYNIGSIYALYRMTPSSRSSNKFSMIKQQWFILRDIERVNMIPALYFMFLYLFNGFKKYII